LKEKKPKLGRKEKNEANKGMNDEGVVV